MTSVSAMQVSRFLTRAGRLPAPPLVLPEHPVEEGVATQVSGKYWVSGSQLYKGPTELGDIALDTGAGGSAALGRHQGRQVSGCTVGGSTIRAIGGGEAGGEGGKGSGSGSQHCW